MKQYNITDATKEEFLRFFAFDVNGITCRPYFERWLYKERTGKLLKTVDEAIEGSQKAFEKYLDFIRQANDSSDVEEKIRLLKEADKAYKSYKYYEKEYQRLDKKLSEGD